MCAGGFGHGRGLAGASGRCEGDEADVRAIALIQFAMELYPEMELGDFHRLLYDARWWATLLVSSQPDLDTPVQYPNMHLAQRILDEAEGGSSAD